jgi:hypothetical protein
MMTSSQGSLNIQPRFYFDCQSETDGDKIVARDETIRVAHGVIERETTKKKRKKNVFQPLRY